MKPRSLAALLAAWAIVTAGLCAWLHAAFALAAEPPESGACVIASVWSRGMRLARVVVARRGDRSQVLDRALASTDGAVVRYEVTTAEGPLPAFSSFLFALSLAPGRDGVRATLRDRTVYLTPDDMLAHQAFKHGVAVPFGDAQIGVDVPLVLALLAEGLGTSVDVVESDATLRRVRFQRGVRADTADFLEPALSAARYLARGVDDAGRFRFLVDGATNQTLPGYDWPRHAGATYFLAEAARRTAEPEIAAATLRAAGLLRSLVTACGARRCVADGDVADVGANALATIAFVEVVRAGLDASLGGTVADLAAFLRAQQRPDGELMHRYDRAASRAIDVQFPYFSGEAALALSRASALLGDAEDLNAARSALAYLVGPGWSFFGNRYYFGEEHWTCNAMADLWERAPSSSALDFCVRWLGFWRRLQYVEGETPYDADGAYGVGPLQVPALTPVASRTEAGLATLWVARRAGLAQGVVDALDTQMKHALLLLVRQQVRSASSSRRGLMADPDAVEGAFPASEVDWSLRADFSQHAGNALLECSSNRSLAK